MKASNHNYDKIENKKNIKDFFSPPLIGLENFGVNSYMNAILQCFSQI